MPVLDHHQYQAMQSVEERLWWYQSLRRVLAFDLPRFLPKGRRVLDAGCGTGMNSWLLQELGYQVTAFDLSPMAVSATRQRGVQSVRVASILKLDFAKANTFDGVICLDVLSVFADKKRHQALSELRRVLKPGGIAVMQVAAYEWLRSTHDRYSRIAERLTLSAFQQEIREVGFEVKKATYRYCLPFPLVATLKVLKRITGWHDREDLFLPSPWINQSLNAMMKLEEVWLQRLTLPFGSSIYVIAQKTS